MNAEEIITLRVTNNLTQKQFAKKIGFSEQTVSRWENGVISISRLNAYRILQKMNDQKNDETH